MALVLGLGAAPAPAQFLEQQKLTAPGAEAADQFGVSVSVSGDTAVVGATLVPCAAGSNCGAAYVYRQNPPYISCPRPGQVMPSCLARNVHGAGRPVRLLLPNGRRLEFPKVIPR